jgi:hypothetical protein
MKTTKKIRQTKSNTKLHNYPNIDRERVWRSTQRITLQSQTGHSIPNTGYTTINMTIPLQYFLRPDLQVQLALTCAIQLIASPPIITQNQSIQNVIHELTGSPGHKRVPYTFGETLSGTAVHTEHIADDVGNVMSDVTEFSATEKPKLTFSNRGTFPTPGLGCT